MCLEACLNCLLTGISYKKMSDCSTGSFPSQRRFPNIPPQDSDSRSCLFRRPSPQSGVLGNGFACATSEFQEKWTGLKVGMCRRSLLDRRVAATESRCFISLHTPLRGKPNLRGREAHACYNSNQKPLLLY